MGMQHLYAYKSFDHFKSPTFKPKYISLKVGDYIFGLKVGDFT